jgi:type II secretory pathway component GspD/PulD (secretin)
MITPGGAVLDQPGGKSLMIVDTPENSRRLIEIKEALDVPALAGARFEVYTSQGMDAEQLADIVNERLREGTIAASAMPINVAPLPAANRVLIVYKNESGLAEARRQLEQADRRPNDRRNIYIYPLNAENTASLENTIAGFKASKRAGPSIPGRQLEITVDEPTRCLIVYATPQELKELRDLINPGRGLEEFKQRIASIERAFEVKPSPKKPTL